MLGGSLGVSRGLMTNAMFRFSPRFFLVTPFLFVYALCSSCSTVLFTSVHRAQIDMDEYDIFSLI